MDIKDLRHFVAVYEARGFQRAAILLGTVQSNVSTRIKNFENLIGAQLFERLPSGAVPTPKARLLYRYAKRVIVLVDRTEEVLRRRDAA
jgi:DNA-binding transcriptional LysR family regulator